MADNRLEPVVLSEVERRTPENWAKWQSTAQGLAQRTRIVLDCADGGSNVARRRPASPRGPPSAPPPPGRPCTGRLSRSPKGITHQEPSPRRVYRFRTRYRASELGFGAVGGMGQDYDQWKVYAGHQELAGAMHRWAADTGAHAMRLVFGGVFDRFPGARLILGHMGEYLPFQLARFGSMAEKVRLPRELTRRRSPTGTPSDCLAWTRPEQRLDHDAQAGSAQPDGRGPSGPRVGSLVTDLLAGSS